MCSTSAFVCGSSGKVVRALLLLVKTCLLNFTAAWRKAEHHIYIYIYVLHGGSYKGGEGGGGGGTGDPQTITVKVSESAFLVGHHSLLIIPPSPPPKLNILPTTATNRTKVVSIEIARGSYLAFSKSSLLWCLVEVYRKLYRRLSLSLALAFLISF